jgi:2-oxoisovalerate dehydrogenase E2 component (dihydrolipoyl transacylase)
MKRARTNDRAVSASQFRLPDVGEGLTEAEIVTWRVAVGDTVAVNDVIVEIETAKSLVELPSPFAGVVESLLVAEGVTVAVGTPIIEVRGGAGAPEREANLVGYGPSTGAGGRRRARHPVTVAEVALEAPPEPEPVPQPEPEPVATEPQPTVRAMAKPPVRKLAKDHGIDLATLTPSGPNGIVTRADVEAARAPASPASPAPAPGVAPATSAPDAARETRIDIRGVRKLTAAAMVQSAFTAPHVTEWVEIDATRTMSKVDAMRASRQYRDVRVTPLLLVARAVCVALRRTPELNATWDEPNQQIVRKGYVNLGIAADTPRGLVVPNIPDADQLSTVELAKAISELTTTAREGRTTPAQMSGGTFTITNIGVFGIDGGTPILNPGEAGILAVGSIRRKPWVVDEQIVARWVTTLALSFDHRMADGAEGSSFLADVAAILEDPGATLVIP